MVPSSISSANANKTLGNLIPGSAKKKSAMLKTILSISAPLPPNVQCWLQLERSWRCEKKVRSCRPFDPCAARQHWTSGAGGQAVVLNSCPTDFFFADPGTPRRGAGGHVMAKTLNASAYATAEKCYGDICRSGLPYQGDGTLARRVRRKR